jgi:hypothetical protein
MISRLIAGLSDTGFVYVGGTTSTGFGKSRTVSMTSLAGGIASQPSAGDLIVVGAGFVDSGRNRDIFMTTSGYTEVADLIAFGDDDVQLGVYYKRLNIPETQLTVSSSSSGESWRVGVHVWRYSRPELFFDAVTTAAVNNAGVPDAPEIVTNVDGALVVIVAKTYHDSTPAPLTAPPGTENFLLVGSGTRSQLGMASIIRETAGSYDPPAFGGGAIDPDDAYCAVTLAFKPE